MARSSAARLAKRLSPSISTPIARAINDPGLSAGGAAPAVTGDPIALTFWGSALNDQGRSTEANGMFVGVTLKGMALSTHEPPVGDGPSVGGLTPYALTANVMDWGYNDAGVLVQKFRTLRNGERGRLPWPIQCAAGTIPPNTWVSNADWAYFTFAGGTQSATLPTHTGGTATTAGSTCAWVYHDAKDYYGFFQVQSGSDVIQISALNGAMYRDTVVISAYLSAGAYNDGAISSNAKAITTFVNNSTLDYEPIIINPHTPPHMAADASGLLLREYLIGHSRATNRRHFACIKSTAWNAARTTSGSTTTVAASSLSTFVTPAGPAGLAVEVAAVTVDTSGVPQAVDNFIETQVYPHLGTNIWDSRLHGEGADISRSMLCVERQVNRGSGGQLYIVAVGGGGTTAATGSGPTGTSTGIADGTVVWDYYGADQTVVCSRNPPAREPYVSNGYRKGYATIDPGGLALSSDITKVYDTEAAALAASTLAINCFSDAFKAATAIKTYHNTAGVAPYNLTTHNDVSGGVILRNAGIYTGQGGDMSTFAVPGEWLTIRNHAGVAASAVEWHEGSSNKKSAKRMRYGGFTWTGTSGEPQLMAGETTITSAIQPTFEVLIENAVLNSTYASRLNPLNGTGVQWWYNSTINGAFTFGGNADRTHQVIMAGCLADVLGGISPLIAVNTQAGNRFKGRDMLVDTRVDYQPAMMHLNIRNCWYSAYSGNALLAHFLKVPGQLPYLGTAIVDTIFDSMDLGGGGKCLQIAADSSNVDARNVVLKGLGFYGARFNLGYNDYNNLSPIRSGWYVTDIITRTFNECDGARDHTGVRQGTRNNARWLRAWVEIRRIVAFLGAEGGAALRLDLGGSFVDPTSKWAPLYDAGILVDADHPLIAAQFVNDTTHDGAGGSGPPNFKPVAGALALGMLTSNADMGSNWDIMGVLRWQGNDPRAAIGPLEGPA